MSLNLDYIKMQIFPFLLFSIFLKDEFLFIMCFGSYFLYQLRFKFVKHLKMTVSSHIVGKKMAKNGIKMAIYLVRFISGQSLC